MWQITGGIFVAKARCCVFHKLSFCEQNSLLFSNTKNKFVKMWDSFRYGKTNPETHNCWLSFSPITDIGEKSPMADMWNKIQLIFFLWIYKSLNLSGLSSRSFTRSILYHIKELILDGTKKHSIIKILGKEIKKFILSL